ncbi:MAG TPA: hypothetical protein VID71_01665, partial [Steroidobacteraceae bacterium]
MSARFPRDGESLQGPRRAALRRAWRISEPDWVAALLSEIRISEAQAAQARQLALSLSARVQRAARVGRGDLLTQLALGSAAGRALLSLAEALLRTADAGNADALVREQLAQVRRDAGSLGLTLALASRLAAAVSDARAEGAARNWGRMGAPAVRGLLRVAMHALGGRFIFATNIESALRRAQRLQGPASRFSFDMLGEAALTAADAERYRAAYE